MPIMSSFQELANDNGKKMNDGTTTERTTNFSTKGRSDTPDGFGVTREEFFNALNKLSGLKVDSVEWKRGVDSEYNQIVAGTTDSKNFDQLKDRALFENSLKYIGIPLIMKDNDGDYIGTWKHRIDQMKHSSGMKKPPQGTIRFVMLGEEQGRK